MKARVSIILVALLVLAGAAGAQSIDNQVSVKNFAGADVGAKILNAEKTCNLLVPCVLVLDPSLSGYAAGVMPSPWIPGIPVGGGNVTGCIGAGCSALGGNAGATYVTSAYLCQLCVVKDYRTGGGALSSVGLNAAGAVTAANIFDVTTFNAKGDGQSNNTGSIAVGSNVLTTSGAPYFQWSDVGKSVTIPDDATVVTNISGGNPTTLTGGATTTITGYIGPNSVTVAAPAAVACAGSCPVAWGTDNTGFITTAYQALNATSGGGVLFFPKGVYLFSELSFVLGGVDFEMTGAGATLLSTHPKGLNVQTILVSGASGPHGVFIHDLTLDYVVPMNTSNAYDYANSYNFTPYADGLRIGNNCNSPQPPAYCVAPYPGALNDVHIDSVKVLNARMSGIEVNYANRVNISNSTVMHAGQGIIASNSVGSVVLHHNVASDTADDLIGVYNNEYLMNPTAQTVKVVIDENTLSYGFAKGIGVGGVWHANIIGNTISNTWAAGIQVEDEAVFNETPSSDVLIALNNIDAAGTYYGAGLFKTAAATDGASGMYFYGTNQTLNNLKVETNIITGYHFHGIEMAIAGGMGVSKATLAGNYINGAPTCAACLAGPILSTGHGIFVGNIADSTSTSLLGLKLTDNWIFNAAQSGILIGGSSGSEVKNNWIQDFSSNPNGAQTEGIGVNYAVSMVFDNNTVINSHAGNYPYAFFHTNTAVSQSRNLYSSGLGQAWTDYSATGGAAILTTYQQVNAQPASNGQLGFFLDSVQSPGQGLGFFSPTSSHMDIMASTAAGSGAYMVQVSGWSATGGVVTFTQSAGPTLAAGQLVMPNTAAGCSSASGLAPLTGGTFAVLAGATSSSFQVATTGVTGSGSGACNFSIMTPAMRIDTGYGGGLNAGYLRLAPVVGDSSGPTHPIEFGATGYYADQAGNFHINSLTLASGATVPIAYAAAWTPAAATVSSCAEQTVTVSGVVTGKEISLNPPATMGAHVWIGSVRVSAANTVAVAFCSDATGGTAPSGSWLFKQ